MKSDELNAIAKAGGVDLPVTFLDGSQSTVRVRFIPRGELLNFVQTIDDVGLPRFRGHGVEQI